MKTRTLMTHSPLLYILILGCAAATHPAKANAQSQTDSIARSIKLDSVVVNARRPVVKSEGSKDIVSVKGSYLSKMGSLGNMLMLTPGITATGQNSFEVLGKGVPKYYIDGREVTEQDIFKTIKSANIDRIEIERNPGAEYPAGTNAVVNIITIRPLKDFISLDIYNTAQLKRKFSENPSFEFKINKGIWNSSLSYDYGTYGNLNKETYFTDVTRAANPFSIEEANKGYSRSFSHNVTFSNDFNISPDHRISFVYNYAGDHDHDDNAGDIHNLTSDSDEWTHVVTKNRTIRNQHSFSLSYFGKTGKNSSLNVSADYSTISSNSRTGSEEQTDGSARPKIVTTGSYSDYNIATVNASYSFMLPLSIRTQIGARYYNTHHPLDYTTDNSLVDTPERHNRQWMDDNVSAGFVSLTRSWAKLTANISGRYEYSHTQIKMKTDDNTLRSARHTSDLLPTAWLAWQPSKYWRFQAYYQRSVSRQGYMGLNPNPVYQNSYLYTSGNADLKPGYTDSYSFYSTWRSLTLGFVYEHQTDIIDNVIYAPMADRNTTCETPINMPRSESYRIFVSYRKSLWKLFFNGMAYVTLPNCEYDYLDQTRKMKHASCSGNLSLSYFINSKFTAFTNFNFQSYNQWQNRMQRAANNWTAGLQANLLDGRLSMSLVASDLLHRAHYNNLTYFYRNTRNGTRGTNDMRGISLTVSYSLFNQNLNDVKASRGDSDIIERTK